MLYINDKIIKEILEANPNFGSLKYEDNKIELDGQVLNLDNLNLIEIFGPYSELKEDIKKETMTANDLFKIIELNVNLKNVNNPLEDEVPSIFEYQELIQSEDEDILEEKKLNSFYSFIEKLYRFRNYLCADGEGYLSNYENFIFNLMIRESLTSKEEEAVAKYESLARTKTKSEEINQGYINKLKLDERRAKNKERAGYANSILVVEIVIMAAITLGSFILLYFLK